MTRGFKNRKALSPVVAAIILIAVTVAVAITVSFWMGTFTFSFMRIEEVKVINHVWASDISYVDLTVRNVGTGAITISQVKVNGEPASSITYMSGSAMMNGGESATIRVAHSFTSEARYEFWIVTATGNKYPYVTEALATTVSHMNWWNAGYSYRRHITITNNMASVLSSGYSVLLTVDTSSSVYSGKMLSSGNDLRIVYGNGTFVELNRDVIDINTASTQVWFKIQADIPANEADNNYDMYYGNPGAGSPLANKSAVYLWFDDFNRADKPNITTETSYSVMTGGGAWSIEASTLKNVGASGDPNKLLITALGNVNTAIDVQVKIKVTSFNGGDVSRMGLSCCMDASPSRGSGYCALLHEDRNSLDLLNDLRSWGTQGTYGWSLNTWYYMRFRVIDPASSLGKVKVWQVGTTEPSTWTVDGNFGSGTARSYGEVGFAGSRTTDTTYFDDILIRYITNLEPSTSLGPEERS